MINKALAFLLTLTTGIGVFATMVTMGNTGKDTLSQGVSHKGTINIVDDTKQLVSLPAVANRVVSISSADSELLLALGVDPVGVVNSKELPPDVQANIAQYPNMNSAVSPSIERIIMTDPNLVIGIAMPFQTALRKSFNDNGIPSFYHMSAHYDGIMEHIRNVGVMTGHEVQAEALISKYNQLLEAIVKRHEGEPKRRVLIVFGTPTSYQLASSKTYVGDIFKRLGVDNVADVYLPSTADDDTLDGYIPLNLETMAILDCDQVILINHGSNGEQDIEAFKKAFKTPAWQNVPAIANGHIDVLPGPLFASVPTARMDQVLLYAEKVLYGQSH